MAYASCPLCGDATILDLLEADCTRHPLYQPALPGTIGWCRCHRCGHVFAEGYFNRAAEALNFSAAPPRLLFVSTPNMDTAVWKVLDAQQANPYWGELEHYHCFSRTRPYALLQECGFEPLHYAVSARYRCGVDVIATKR